MSLFGNLRKRAGLIFAALVVVAMLMPTADIFACGGEVENAPVSNQQVIAKAVISQQDSGKLQGHDNDGDSCPHGHRHHGFSIAKMSERNAFSIRMISLSLNPGIERPRGSAPPFELLRPPRA